MSPSYRLIIDCPDRVGIVAEVSAFIAQHHGWLLEASYHSDQETGRFYMRNEIKVDSLDLTLSEFRQQFAALAQRVPAPSAARARWPARPTPPPRGLV